MRLAKTYRAKLVTRKVRHMNWYRKHFAVPEAKIDRMLVNKGMQIGQHYTCGVNNPAGRCRCQRLISEIVRTRLGDLT